MFVQIVSINQTLVTSSSDVWLRTVADAGYE